MSLTLRQERLLRELYGLLAKYGSADQEAALAALRSGESVTLIASLAEEARVSSRPTKGQVSGAKKKTSNRELLDRDIERLRLSGLDRDARLAELLARVRDGRILPTSSAILGLLTPFGVRTPRSLDRLALIRTLGQTLQQLSDDELDELLRIANDSVNGGSSLQRWTNIIVKGDHK